MIEHGNYPQYIFFISFLSASSRPMTSKLIYFPPRNISRLSNREILHVLKLWDQFRPRLEILSFRIRIVINLDTRIGTYQTFVTKLLFYLKTYNVNVIMNVFELIFHQNDYKNVIKNNIFKRILCVMKIWNYFDLPETFWKKLYVLLSDILL